MRILKQRVLATIAATVAAAACGTLAGYLLGLALTVRHAETRLSPYAERILQEAETAAHQARTELATIKASHYSFCSDQEIAWLHKLVFQSEYLKDAGRIRDGKIECSATLDRLPQPAALPTPDFSLNDGTRLYRNLGSFQIADQTVIMIQQGSAFAVYSPYNLVDLGSGSMHYTVTEVDAASRQAGRLVGESSQAPVPILTTEGQTRAGDTMYVTRCSPHYASCITAYISTPEALRDNRGEFSAYMVAGGLVGAVFSLVCSLLYRRNKGIEQQLRRAIRHNALWVVYQPIVELASRRIVGAEALVRWSDEDGVAVSPELFVKIAENRGFVGAITEIVVKHGLASFAETLRSHSDFRLSINVTAADLKNPSFLPMLERSVKREGVSPQSLALEITESSTALHEIAIETIRHLREKGHSIHIDDFGTGYSSLSYLHDLSVDAIKIDRSFTRAIGTEAVTVAILPQILALAAALKLQVIVEGIETEQQANYFADSGQPILAQGWFFGRPVPAEAFLRVLAEEEQAISVPADHA
jgi:sensor c-di-GMP phosphodiesterase-like protein